MYTPKLSFYYDDDDKKNNGDDWLYNFAHIRLAII